MDSFVHFLWLNGPNMDTKREPKLTNNETWALWTANGRPTGPQSLQNGTKWDPQSSQNGDQDLPTDTENATQSDRCLKGEFKFCRAIPKKIYDKKVLRRCSAQRAQSAAALLGV